jgi:hypothetical protein
LSVICKVAEREPLAFGLKLTLIVQLLLLPAASEPPQVFPVTTKSAEFGPVIVNPEIVKAPIPGLLSVTVLAVVSSPTVSVPKLNDDGLTLAFGAITVAVMPTFCGLPEAVSVQSQNGRGISYLARPQAQRDLAALARLQRRHAAAVIGQVLIGDVDQRAQRNFAEVHRGGRVVGDRQDLRRATPQRHRAEADAGWRERDAEMKFAVTLSGPLIVTITGLLLLVAAPVQPEKT